MSNQRGTPDGTVEGLMRSLRQIAGDLWAAPTDQQVNEAKQAVDRDFTEMMRQSRRDGYLPQEEDLTAAADVPAEEPEQEKAPAEAEPQPEQPVEMWKAVDDAVDWTEALTLDHAPEGMDGQTWAWRHDNAAAVLAGDTEAYGRVIEQADPMGNLMTWMNSVRVEVTDADTLTVNFDCKPELLAEDPDHRGRYLCGLSLRIARDLMNLLPVRKVRVLGWEGERGRIDVTFPRTALQKQRFIIVDPEELAAGVGAVVDAAE